MENKHPKSLKHILRYAHPRNFREGHIMYCRYCGAEYSAHPSDYFWASPTDTFKCCNRVMVILPQKECLRKGVL